MTETRKTEDEKNQDTKSEDTTSKDGQSQDSKSENSRTRKETRSGAGARSNGARQTPGPMAVLREARLQLAELTGMEAESVSAFERTEDGWHLEIEVLELTRVPDTMSLLASYAVDLDPQGQLMGYRRIRRYERGRADAQRPGGR